MLALYIKARMLSNPLYMTIIKQPNCYKLSHYLRDSKVSAEAKIINASGWIMLRASYFAYALF